jgi:hypothetical protein
MGKGNLTFALNFDLRERGRRKKGAADEKMLGQHGVGWCGCGREGQEYCYFV